MRIHMKTNSVPVILAAIGLLGAGPAAVRAAEADVHHVHITTSSPSEGVRWYSEHFGCKPIAERTDAASCGRVELLFESESPRTVPPDDLVVAGDAGVEEHRALGVADQVGADDVRRPDRDAGVLRGLRAREGEPPQRQGSDRDGHRVILRRRGR